LISKAKIACVKSKLESAEASPRGEMLIQMPRGEVVWSRESNATKIFAFDVRGHTPHLRSVPVPMKKTMVPSRSKVWHSTP
jgi:hypothetical protein